MASRFGRFRGFTQMLFGNRPVPARRPAGTHVGDFVHLDDRIVPATFVVTNILDNQQDTVGGLSLRKAILAANANPGFDRIEFNIPRSPSLPTVPGLPQENYFPIVLASTLPDLTDPAGVTIDATTQPRVTPYLTTELVSFTDVNGNPDTKLVPVSPEDPRNLDASRPLVQLLPDPNPGAFPGLKGAYYVSGPNNVIRGFVITGFPGSGVNLVGSASKNNIVISNWINTDISGTKSWNQDPFLTSARPTNTPEELTNAGPNPLVNPRFVLGGVTITGGATDNVIGGTIDAGGRPLVDAGGTVLGDGGIVIRTSGANSTDGIPVTPAINRNVISGTREFRKDYYNYLYIPTPVIKAYDRDLPGTGTGPGIRIQDPGTRRNLVQGNYIGTDFTGSAGIPNINGIEIFNAASDNFVGNPTGLSDPDGITAGSTLDDGPVASGVGNLVRFNDYDGVRIAATPYPAQRTTRTPPMRDPSPIPFDEGDDILIVTPTGANVPSGFGPFPAGGGIYNGPFYDAYNPNYFVGGAPGQGGNIIGAAVTDPVTGVTSPGAQVQVGATLVLRGSSLLGATAVSFPTAAGAGARINGRLTVIDDSTLQVVVPAGAVTGAVNVSSPGGVFVGPTVVILPSPPPTLDISSNFTPSSGQIGSTVTINGTNFLGTTQVLFNGQPASSFQVQNGGKTITAVVPTGATTGPIRVINPAGDDVSTRDFAVLTAPPPTINAQNDPTAPGFTDLNGAPIDSGIPGSKLVINGVGFTGLSLIRFGASGGQSGFGTTDFTVNTAGTQIVVTVPATVVTNTPITGLIAVRAGGGDGFSNQTFTIQLPTVPAGIAVAPTSGVAGTTVNISGSGFTSASGVTFGGVPATSFQVLSDTNISAVVPSGIFSLLPGAGDTRDVNVAVQTAATSVTGPTFQVQRSALPTASDIPAAQQNTLVIINGTNLLSASKVVFGSTPTQGVSSTDITVLSDTQIQVLVPVGASTGNYFVITDGGVSSAANVTIIPNVVPVIGEDPLTDPVSAVQGTTVTLRGNGLLGTQRVLFTRPTDANGRPTGVIDSPSVTVIDDSTITAVVPFGAGTGPVTVLSPTDPLLPARGTRITLTSSTGGLTTATTAAGTVAPGTELFFTDAAGNLTPGSELTITSMTGTRDTQITAVVPANAVSGPIQVKLPNGRLVSVIPVLADGTAGAAVTADFTLLATPAPTIRSVFPSSGVTVGTLVTVSGAGFTGLKTLIIGGVQATEVTVLSDTQVRFRVPQLAGTGAVVITVPPAPGGTTDQSVTGPQVNIGPSPQPTITFSTPGAARNTPITVAGSGLQGTSKVTFNDVSADFEIISDRQLTVTVPQNANPGVIRVFTPGGTAVSPNQFDVTAANPPVLSSVIDLETGGLEPPIAGPDAGPIGSKFVLNGTAINGSVFSVTLTQVIDGVAVGFGAAAKLGRDPQTGNITFFELPDLVPGTYQVNIAASVKGGGLTTDSSFQTSVNFLGQTLTYGEVITVLPNARPVVDAVTVNDTDNVTLTTVPAIRGAPLAITGSGFTGATLVTIGDPNDPNEPFVVLDPTEFTVFSDTKILTNIPIPELPGVGAIADLEVQVFAPAGVPGDVTDDLGSNTDKTLNVVASPGLGFATAAVGLAIYGGDVTLTAPFGSSFYGVSNLAFRVATPDANGAILIGTANAPIFRELGDPAPFVNFVVVPGTGGRVVTATIPADLNLPPILDKKTADVTVSATTNTGATDVSNFTIGKNAAVASSGAISLVDDPFTLTVQEFFNDRKIRIFGSADVKALTGIVSVDSVTFDMSDGGKLTVDRNNFTIVPPGLSGRNAFAIDVLLPTRPGPNGRAVPTGQITITTVDGTANTTFTPVVQKAANLFEFQTVTAPPQNNRILANLIYQNGPFTDDVRDAPTALTPVGNLLTRGTSGTPDQLAAFQVGALGVDFVTADPIGLVGFDLGGTGLISGRQYPYIFGYGRQEVLNNAGPNFGPERGNQGKGGLNDGVRNSFTAPVGNNKLPTDIGFDRGSNTFNNVQGGRFFGPNLLQNFPLLQVVLSSIDRTTFSTALLGKPFRPYRIDYYYNPQFNDSDATSVNTTNAGYGEVFLGSKVINTDFQGNGSVSFTIFQKLPGVGQTEADLVYGPGEFKLPDNRPIPNAVGSGVVVAVATDLSPVGLDGASILNGPDGSSRYSFFKRPDAATGGLASAAILDANRNGKADPTQVVTDANGNVIRTIPGELGTGVPNATVELFPDRGDGTFSDVSIATLTTDTSGGFQFVDGQGGGLGLPNGRQKVVVTIPANKGFEFVQDTSDSSGTVTINSATQATLFVQIVNGELVSLQEVDTNADGIGDSLQGPRLLARRVDVPPPPPPPPPPQPPGPPVPPVPPTGGPGVLPANLRLLANGADAGAAPVVAVYNPDRSFRFTFPAYDAAFTGGVRTAVADVTGDQLPDIVTAPGEGIPGLIKVFDGTSGQLVTQFQPYEQSFTGGVYVAAADTNGDGVADIVTGTGVGGGPRVQVFSGGESLLAGQPLVLSNFFPYEDTFRGGVLVNAGYLSSTDTLSADGKTVVSRTLDTPVIITGTGVGGGPRVQVFDAGTLQPRFNYFAYENTFRGGVFASIGDVDGNGQAEIITGTGPGGGPSVKVFGQDAFSSGLAEPPAATSFFAYDPNFRGGVRVDALDGGTPGAPGNFDGRLDIVTAPGPGLLSDVRVIDFATLQDVYRLQPFDPSFLGGVFIGAGR